MYANADVLALVSSYEPFGVTLREGAAAGLPLICSRRAGAVGDVAVDGENALVVDPDNRGRDRRALRRLVREPELRERLAAGSQAVTDRHPPEADAEAWERAVLRGPAASRAARAAARGSPSCTASGRYARSSRPPVAVGAARSSGISKPRGSRERARPVDRVGDQ